MDYSSADFMRFSVQELADIRCDLNEVEGFYTKF